MKRIALICAGGIAVGYWYPELAIAAGVGVLIGWNVLEQPKAMKDFIDGLKMMLK